MGGKTMNKRFIRATAQRCEFEQHVAAPYFRKSFDLNFLIKKASLSICGLGFYRLWINGQEITKGALAPYISNPDHFCYYDTYDLLPYLRKGKNAIGVLLGNGMMNPMGGVEWDFDKAPWRGAPCLALECEILGKENERLFFEADPTFLVHSSPITFDDLRFGEHYDARQETEDWSTPDFDDRTWQPALPAIAPKGELRLCRAEPIRVIEERKPVSIIKKENGYLYDFGCNSAGVCRLQISAKSGQRITMTHGEVLSNGELYLENLYNFSPVYHNGYAYKHVYLAKDGEQAWTSSFVYHGFRYVLVEGITEDQATKELLTYLVMSSELVPLGSFSCSDERLNTVWHMVDNSVRSNFYYFPTDCPHREKNGWTGDASMSAHFMTLMYDTQASYTEWLRNIRRAQNEAGVIPGIVPTDTWGYGFGPVWDGVIVNLPYRLYKLRGDRRAICENADAIVRSLKHFDGRREPNGLYVHGLGDWCPVGKRCDDYDSPREYAVSVMLMNLAEKAEEMFSAVGLTEKAQYAKTLRDGLRESIRRECVDFSTMTVVGNCQTSQALAIYYNLLDEEEKPLAFSRLLDFIHAKGDTFDCGFLGMHTVFHVLSAFGEGELAYRMITHEGYPSYTHLIDRGVTAMPEHFLPDGDLTKSFNHHFFGDVTRWMMSSVAGLKVISDREIEICPDLLTEISHAKASYRLPSGEVLVEWERRDGKVLIRASHPKSVSCRISDRLVGENIILEIE
jgi:alpha-L-rhamnosidase